MGLSRNKEQYVIMTVIYDELADFTYGNKEFVRSVVTLVEGASELPYEEVSSFVKDVITYALKNYGAIKAFYNPYLHDWTWERLPLLTQSILLMTYAHNEVEKAAKGILINTALELAKTYIGDNKQKNFINAVLDEAL